MGDGSAANSRGEVGDPASPGPSPSPSRLPLPAWGAAWILCAVYMLSNAGTPLYVLWQQEIGFSSGTLTLIFSAYIGGLLMTLTFSGQLAARYGRKQVLLPALALAAASCGVAALAHSAPALIAARFVLGLAMGIVVAAGTASVLDLGGGTLRRRAAFVASLAMVAGAGLGPLLAGLLAQFLAQPILPIFALLLALQVSALIVAAVLPLAPRQAGPRPGMRIGLPQVGPGDLLPVLLAVAAFAPAGSGTAFILALGPSLLDRVLGVSSSAVAGGMASIMLLSAFLAQVTVRGLRLRRAVQAGPLFTILAMGCLVATVQVGFAGLLLATAVLAGAGMGLGQLGALTLIGLRVQVRYRTEASALLHLCVYAPAGLLPVASGYLVDATGLPVGATAFALLLSTLCCGAVWAIRAKLVDEGYSSRR